jgi:hypothetical protein
MCNACGFFCCAYDGFSGCGCDHCPCAACRDDDDEDYEDYEDDGFYCDEVEPPAPDRKDEQEAHSNGAKP